MRRVWGAVAGIAVAVLAGASAAQAEVTIGDGYYGGMNTYNGQDVIGDTNVFDIKDATFERINAGNTLRVTIRTNYAGAPGSAAALGTGYGAFFITPGANAWTPTGTAPYANDVYQAGDWAYAFTVPFNPGASTSGSGSLYAISDGTVVMSNVGGNPVTYPNPGNGGYYFRQGQAVQFTPNGNASAVAGGSWSVQPGKLVFDINDNQFLGNSFAFSWAMTCGNDVIQGQVAGIPEPSTWALLILGFGGCGVAVRRRRSLAHA
ncbi:MAG: hypothetical protein DI570_13800 [Phenylobacterium zucineum]|nr:MAG: hypothetical protein DI570_13800 [Phenylobacterium zucineum]